MFCNLVFGFSRPRSDTVLLSRRSRIRILHTSETASRTAQPAVLLKEAVLPNSLTREPQRRETASSSALAPCSDHPPPFNTIPTRVQAAIEAEGYQKRRPDVTDNAG